jgi:hypothetical protein
MSHSASYSERSGLRHLRTRDLQHLRRTFVPSSSHDRTLNRGIHIHKSYRESHYTHYSQHLMKTTHVEWGAFTSLSLSNSSKLRMISFKTGGAVEGMG